MTQYSDAVAAMIAAIKTGPRGSVTPEMVTDAVVAITDTLAPLDSAPLTGTPTAPTAAPGVNTDQIASTAFVTAAIAALVNSSPATLDTLKELADALGDDANFAATMTSALAAKAPLASPAFTGDPTAPTPSPGDNDQSIATTAFVNTAIGARREVLTANRTYYVRSDGSDSNNGQANTSGGAFLTIQKALDTVYNTLDLAGFNVTIQVQAGTWTQSIAVNYAQVGSGTIALIGDETTPSNVVISTTGNCVTVDGPGSRLTVRGFRLLSSGGNCLQASNNCRLNFGAVQFGSTSQYHIRSDSCANVILLAGSSYSIVGGSQGHILTLASGNVTISGATVTLTGTPAWSAAFATISGGTLVLFNVTFSGSATGLRYAVTLNGVINSFGTGTASTYFPGNSNGTTATGGVQG